MQADRDGADRAIDLAHAPDFRLGGALIRPAFRSIACGGRTEYVEPRVMQVLLALDAAGGRPLTRDELIDRCWGGRIVSEDAITRAVAKLRQLGALFEGRVFAVETIPKVGYRLIGSDDCATDHALLSPTVAPGPAPIVPIDPRKRAAPYWRWLATGAAGLASILTAAMLVRADFAAPARDAGAAKIALPKSPQVLEADRLHLSATRLFLEKTRPGYAEAEKLLRHAVALDPTNAPSWARLAMAVRAPAWWAAQDDPEAMPRLRAEAIGYARRALAIDPNLAEANYAMGYVLWEYDSRMPWFQRAVALDPNFAEAWNGLGIAYENRDELRPALAALQRGLELDPTSSALTDNTANLLHRLGQRREALAIVDRFGRTGHRPDFTLNMKLNLALAEGHLTAAARDATEMLALKPNDPWKAQINLLSITHLLGDDAASRRLIAKQPKLADVIASYDSPEKALRLATTAPDEWWEDLYPEAKARHLLRRDRGDLLVALYDREYDSPGRFVNECKCNSLSLGPAIVIALRGAGRTREAALLRDLIAAELVKLRHGGDRSFYLGVLYSYIAAIDGRAGDAAAWLDQGVTAGWRGQAPDLGVDPAIDPVYGRVRDDPRFRRAIARYNAAVAAEATDLRRLNLARTMSLFRAEQKPDA